MAIKNFFKKKEEKTEKEPIEKRVDLTKEKNKIEKQPKKVKKEQTGSFKKEKKNSKTEAYQILKSAHITEKAGDLEKKNQYIFKVFPRANKTEIKKAVESIYGVDVESIKIINTFEKKRRLGKIKGISPGYKKTIVKIKKGQKIEAFQR